jgi:hypothetical protein
MTYSNAASGPISSTTASSNRASANADNGRLIGTGWSIEEQEARWLTEIGPTTFAEETSCGHEDPKDDQASI